MSLSTVLVIGAAVAVGAWWSSRSKQGRKAQDDAVAVEDAKAEAMRWIERLGNQVLTISGTDAASTQAMADASERYNAAFGAMTSVKTVKQARLAQESALEGLHYVNAAREIMGMAPGPALPALAGQEKAGKVTERRTVDAGGQTLTASPYASAETPNYYPGGIVAGRPVPAGWYSRPWWADALTTGVWMVGYSMMFNSLFHGMSGIHYTGEQAEAGEFAGDAIDAGDDFGGGLDGGDAGDAGEDDEGLFGDIFGGDGGFDFGFGE